MTSLRAYLCLLQPRNEPGGTHGRSRRRGENVGQRYQSLVSIQHLTKDTIIMRTIAFAAALALGLTACGGGGGGEEAPEAAPSTEMAPAAAPAAPAETFGMPDWMEVDNDDKSVEIHLTAGLTPDNNHWNYNGYYGGRGGITVPLGYTIHIDFVNQDPAMAHSFGIEMPQATYPNQITEMNLVFPDAHSTNPLSMTTATMPGTEEDHSFVADQAGDFVMLCYQTGHAATGMWIDFTVSADGESGAMIAQ
jgi:FtsP/CotA-like multicopper oxidase with cupredoxin domain